MDRTILPATAGEDASGAEGVAVVKAQERNLKRNPQPRQRKPDFRPKMGQGRQTNLRFKLLRESQLFKGSQQ